MLYWIERDIGSAKGNVKKHQFSTLEQFSEKTIRLLLERGVIREIQAPPIEVIPEFRKYGTLLRNQGIRTLMDILAHRQTLHDELNVTEVEAQSLVSKAEKIMRPDLPLSDGG